MRRIARAIVVFPAPVSPTRASVFPFFKSNDIPVTARTFAPLVGITDDERDAWRSDAVQYKTPDKMSPELAYLLGAYFANGAFSTSNRLRYHCGYLELHKKVQSLWFDLFGVETNIIRLKDRDSYIQDFASVMIRAWLKKNGVIKYDEEGKMVVPKVVRESSWRSIVGFITGYADNDGCFFGKTFCIDTAQESFARHMQELGETVGLCFGFSINSARSNSFSKKPIYKINLQRSFSNIDAIDLVNQYSVKARLKGPVLPGQRAS